jgi:delta 1-pyrroline-5-carboxylate dehydrogenase
MSAATTQECLAFGADSAASSLMAIVTSHNVLAVSVLTLASLLVYLLNDKYQIIYHTKLWIEYATTSVPTMEIDMTPAEATDEGVKGDPVVKMELVNESNPKLLNCYDPSTRQLLGTAPNMSAEQVHEILVKAKAAQAEWKNTTFAQRRMVLRTIQKYVCQHVADICRVSSRESGKPMVDAVVGEIITTCEKIRTICEWGEAWLQPSFRPTGPMMMHKTAWVEYVPLGVIAPIAPWNYPFHNSVSITTTGTIYLCQSSTE